MADAAGLRCLDRAGPLCRRQRALAGSLPATVMANDAMERVLLACWSCVCLLLCLPGAARAAPSELHLVSLPLPDAQRAGAVCNDGSAPGYYIRDAPGLVAGGGDEAVWMVHLEGGFACWDAASCAARNASSPALMGSGSWPDARTLGGIFDGDAGKNPLFAAARAVYVPYCTSDSWIGDSPDATATPPWVFRGRRVLDAVLRDLQESQHMQGDNVAVVLTGCSAGARGALYNLDRVCACSAPRLAVAWGCTTRRGGWTPRSGTARRGTRLCARLPRRASRFGTAAWWTMAAAAGRVARRRAGWRNASSGRRRRPTW